MNVFWLVVSAVLFFSGAFLVLTENTIKIVAIPPFLFGLFISISPLFVEYAPPNGSVAVFKDNGTIEITNWSFCYDECTNFFEELDVEDKITVKKESGSSSIINYLIRVKIYDLDKYFSSNRKKFMEAGEAKHVFTKIVQTQVEKCIKSRADLVEYGNSNDVVEQSKATAILGECLHRDDALFYYGIKMNQLNYFKVE